MAHVALCDNEHVRCGGAGRGDGDDLSRNLYWATSGGFAGWFGRRGSGWTRVTAWPNPSSEILETVVWRRHQLPTPELRARGVTRRFGVYVIAHAWRGRAIDRALDRYVADPWTADAAPVTLPDGTRLAGGGGAHVVAYVGHNRWMDHRTPYRFPPETPDAPVKEPSPWRA